jgi:hypothetical protein
MKLNLEQIRMDGGTQPRSELLIEVMEDYAEQMLAGVEFPPIVVFFDGKDYWLADGFHRMGAALRARPDKPIEAEVIQGTQSEAQWYSLGANKLHGLRRTRPDRTRAIQAALQHPQGARRSDREIAEHIGVSPTTVAKYRASLNLRSGVQNGHLQSRRTGKDGKQYPVSNFSGQKNNPAKNKSHVSAPNRTTLKIHEPTRAPNLQERMTTVNMPHDPVMGAMTLIEVFEPDYLSALITELSIHLKGLEA